MTKDFTIKQINIKLDKTKYTFVTVLVKFHLLLNVSIIFHIIFKKLFIKHLMNSFECHRDNLYINEVLFQNGILSYYSNIDLPFNYEDHSQKK